MVHVVNFYDPPRAYQLRKILALRRMSVFGFQLIHDLDVISKKFSFAYLICNIFNFYIFLFLKRFNFTIKNILDQQAIFFVCFLIKTKYFFLLTKDIHVCYKYVILNFLINNFPVINLLKYYLLGIKSNFIICTYRVSHFN